MFTGGKIFEARSGGWKEVKTVQFRRHFSILCPRVFTGYDQKNIDEGKTMLVNTRWENARRAWGTPLGRRCQPSLAPDQYITFL